MDAAAGDVSLRLLLCLLAAGVPQAGLIRIDCVVAAWPVALSAGLLARVPRLLFVRPAGRTRPLTAEESAQFETQLLAARARRAAHVERVARECEAGLAHLIVFQEHPQLLQLVVSFAAPCSAEAPLGGLRGTREYICMGHGCRACMAEISEWLRHVQAAHWQ